jgi:hypothetical protein
MGSLFFQEYDRTGGKCINSTFLLSGATGATGATTFVLYARVLVLAVDKDYL